MIKSPERDASIYGNEQMVNITFPVCRASLDHSAEHSQYGIHSPFSLDTVIFKTCCYFDYFHKQNRIAKNLEKCYNLSLYGIYFDVTYKQIN